jgi:hypothetical protein
MKRYHLKIWEHFSDFIHSKIGNLSLKFPFVLLLAINRPKKNPTQPPCGSHKPIPERRTFPLLGHPSKPPEGYPNGYQRQSRVSGSGRFGNSIVQPSAKETSPALHSASPPRHCLRPPLDATFTQADIAICSFLSRLRLSPFAASDFNAR